MTNPFSATFGALFAAVATIIVAPVALGQSGGAAQPDSTSPPARAETAPDRAQGPDLEEQLAAARRRLDEAAREVAELSAERGQAVMRRYSAIAGMRARAVIGLQLDMRGGQDGAKVLDVSPGGPAAEAGIRSGDMITEVNGTAVRGEDAARRIVRIIRGVQPDSKVRIGALRGGKKLQFTVTARPGPEIWAFDGAMAPPMPPARPVPPGRSESPYRPFGAFPPPSLPFLMQGPLADMELATLTPGLGSYFGTDKGVLVLRAPRDGALKLEDGDVIVSIDGRVPESGTHATRILASYQPGEKITLEIMRHRKAQKIVTTMPAGGYRDRKALLLRRGEVDAPAPPRRIVILRREGPSAAI